MSDISSSSSLLRRLPPPMEEESEDDELVFGLKDTKVDGPESVEGGWMGEGGSIGEGARTGDGVFMVCLLVATCGYFYGCIKQFILV